MINSKWLLSNESIQWTIRVTLFIIFSVFLDTLFRLRNLSETHEHSDHDSLSDLQFKAKLFYTHRNMYLSMFSLFMVLVNYRRILDVFGGLSDKIEIEELKKEIKLLNVEKMDGEKKDDIEMTDLKKGVKKE